MLKPVVELRPDKSVNVFSGGFLFKLSAMGHHNRPQWNVATDRGLEPIANPEVQKRLNRLWINKVYCAPHAPDPIPRFPRRLNQQVAELLSAATKDVITELNQTRLTAYKAAVNLAKLANLDWAPRFNGRL